MKITPLDIQQQKFKIRFRGFDPQEVDLFLEQIADGFESLLKENEKLQEEIRRLGNESQGYKKREEKMLKNLLN
jgi:cell division initiation protein